MVFIELDMEARVGGVEDRVGGVEAKLGLHVVPLQGDDVEGAQKTSEDKLHHKESSI